MWTLFVTFLHAETDMYLHTTLVQKIRLFLVYSIILFIIIYT